MKKILSALIFWGVFTMSVNIFNLPNGKNLYTWNATVPSQQTMSGIITSPNTSIIQSIEADNTSNANPVTLTELSSGWGITIQPGQRIMANCPGVQSPVYSLAGNNANLTVYLYDYPSSSPGVISQSANDLLIAGMNGIGVNTNGINPNTNLTSLISQLEAVAGNTTGLANQVTLNNVSSAIGKVANNTSNVNSSITVYLNLSSTSQSNAVNIGNPPVGTAWYVTGFIITGSVLYTATPAQGTLELSGSTSMLFYAPFYLESSNFVTYSGVYYPLIPIASHTFGVPVPLNGTDLVFGLFNVTIAGAGTVTANVYLSAF